MSAGEWAPLRWFHRCATADKSVEAVKGMHAIELAAANQADENGLTRAQRFMIRVRADLNQTLFSFQLADPLHDKRQTGNAAVTATAYVLATVAAQAVEAGGDPAAIWAATIKHVRDEFDALVSEITDKRDSK